MKKRMHKGECDPALRAKALARKQAATKAKAETKPNAKSGGQLQKKEKTKIKNKPGTTNAVRKHPLDTYKEWHCQHCKKEDVAPKYCKHKPQVCFRRPGGPMDGITDPEEREKKSRELSAKRREKTLKEQTLAKTNAIEAIGVTRTIETTPANGSTTDMIPESRSTTYYGVRDSDIPSEEYTPEELAGTTWSKPSRVIKNARRYLISKLYNENPLTRDDLDILIPTDLHDSEFVRQTVVKHYAEYNKGEAKLHCFLKNKRRYAARYQEENHELWAHVRQRRDDERERRRNRNRADNNGAAGIRVTRDEPSSIDEEINSLQPTRDIDGQKRIVEILSKPEYQRIFTAKGHMRHYFDLKRNMHDDTVFNGLALKVLKTDILNRKNPTPDGEPTPKHNKVHDRRKRRKRNDPASSEESSALWNPTSPAYTPNANEAYVKKRKQAEGHESNTHAKKKTKTKDDKDAQPAIKIQYGVKNKFEPPEEIVDLRHEDGSESPQYSAPRTEDERMDEEVLSLQPTRNSQEKLRIARVLSKPRNRYYFRLNGHLSIMEGVVKYCRKPWGGFTPPFPCAYLEMLKKDIRDRCRTADKDVTNTTAAASAVEPEESSDSDEKYVPTPIDEEYSPGSYSVSDNSDDPDDTDDDSSSASNPVTSSNCITITRSNVRITPAEVATHVAPPKIKIEKIRWGAIKDRLEDMKSIPMGLWCPATSKNKPLGVTCINNQKRAEFNDSESRLASEKPYTRLLQAYMQIKTPSGEIIKGRVQLDTQSNVNYVLAEHALPRAIRPWESTHCIGISNQIIKLGIPNQLTVMKHGKPIAIDTVRAKPQMFRHGCVALLGTDAIHTLGIDLNYHVDNEEHVDIKYREDSLNNEVCIRAEEQALERYPTFQQLERQLIKKTYLSERICAEYLKKTPDEYKEKPIPLESIDICPDVPPEIRAMIIALLRRYESVFSKKTNELPRPLKHVEAHKFKLKPGATPTRVGRPKFGPSQAKIINDWLDWALNCTTVINGKVVKTPLVEPAETTSWSSRLVLAPKYKSTTAKSSVPDGIRVTWAGTGANEMIQKTVPTYPDAWQQLYKVANFKYKFSADGLKQYWSIPLDEKSREITAFWTPRGLFKFTRLVMGTKNAATVAQNAYTQALNTFLNEKSQDYIANFADDFFGGDDTYEGLLFHFEEFLKMCRETNITINPAKVRIGYIREQWYGLTVENGKISPADRNLDPVRRMTAPKNKSDLRSILGVFNQFSNFIQDYMKEGSPAKILNSLMPKSIDFKWTKIHEQALQDLKKIVLEDGICLFAPDHNHKLILETDASNDGWGAILYQKINGEKRIIKMWSKAWKTEAWKKKPTYHREAKAWMNGLTLTIPYALCNKHPVECWTDHTPLTWIKHTSGKGPVSQFIIDKLSIIDYEMHYIKGKDNDPADTLSRFPLIGPRTLQQSGTRNALDIMLAALVGTQVDPSKLWIYAGKGTKFMIDDIQEWRHNINRIAQRPTKAREQCYMDLFSTSNIRRLKYTLGIWAPDADKVTQQCHAAFKKGVPFACLVPNELVRHIARDHRGELDTSIAKMVEASFKITLLSPGLTWIIHGVDFSKSQPPIKTVHNMDRVTPDFDLVQLCQTLQESSMTPPLPEARTRADWIKEQKKHHIKPLWTGTEGVFQAQDGLLVYQEEEGAPLKTIVPGALQIPLVERQHKAMCHVGSQKIFSALKRSFHWKNMRRTCRHVNDMCALCNLLKARMKHAHKHFRPKIFCTPRTAYGADYYGVGKKNSKGYNNILGIIDLATGHLVLRALKQRTAANTAHTLFYDIINNKGVSLLFHSDAVREFLSTAMGSLTKTLGIVQTSTLAHNPKSNAKIERVWQFVGRCLQAMNAAQYAEFHKYVPIMAHVWNTVTDSETGITPFQAEHGMPCRSIAESILQQPPAEGLPATADDLKSIAVSVHAFNEHISNVKAVEKAQAAIRLNASGNSRIHYQVGDQVGFYLPPDDKTAKAMGKKKKHLLQYVGPGEIVAVLSPNNTAFRIKYQNRHYERNVMHLSKYKSLDQVPGDLQVAVDTEITVGSFIAVLDDSEDRRYHVAKVIDITDDNTVVQYYGTKSRQLRGAKWMALFHHPGTNEVVPHEPTNLVRNWARFTGVVETRSMDDSLVILPNLGLTDTMRLNAATRKLLNRTEYQHHIMGRTW